MALQIVLICVEAVIVMAFLPMRISVTGHVSLERMRAQLDVRLFAFRLVRVRLCVKDGRFLCTVNGKKPQKPSADPAKMLEMAGKFACSHIRRRGVTAVRICLEDAMSSAAVGAMIEFALLPIARGGVYISNDATFEADICLKMKINMLEIADIAL